MRGILEAVRPFPVIPSQVTGIRPAIGDIRNGLVLDMDFGRRYNSNTQVANQSQNGNNGTIHGATWTAGRVGQTLSFDGVDDYVDCGSNDSLELQTLTIEMWLKPTSLAGTNHIIFTRGLHNVDGYYFLLLANGMLGFYTSQSGAVQITATSGGVVTNNVWYHVSVTREGTSARIYVNGLEDSATKGTHLDCASPNRSAKIGTHDNGSTYPYNGLIDEVRIYNRALSAEEIRQRYVYSNMQAGILI